VKKLELARLCSRVDRAHYHRMHQYGSLLLMDCPVCWKELYVDDPTLWVDEFNRPMSSIKNSHIIKHLLRHTKQQLEAACLVQTMVLS
jgi:hypothetical protein